MRAVAHRPQESGEIEAVGRHAVVVVQRTRSRKAAWLRSLMKAVRSGVLVQ